MFTGIVTEQVEASDDLGDSVRITVRGPLVSSDVRPGGSIAVDGLLPDRREGDVVATHVGRPLTHLAGKDIG